MKTYKYIVYVHINKLNNKVYVGQTHFADPNKRWKNGKGYKNGIFKSAIIKYGWDAFLHIIMARGLTKDSANRLESSLIRIYKKKNLSYNITDGGEGAVGYKHSEEAKRKMSAKGKGKKFPEYLKSVVSERMKTVIRTTEWKNNISKALKGIPKSDQAKYNMKHSDKTPFSRKVVMLDYTGTSYIKTFSSVKEAALYIKAPATHISRCCKGKRKHCRNYTFKYKEDYELT